MQRREFVAGAAATTTAMLAGCGLLGGDGGGPEGAVEDYYDAFNDNDRDAFDDILHSESPLRPLGEGGGEDNGFEISVEGTEVTDDGPSEDAIRDQWAGDATLYSDEELQTMVEIVDSADDAAIVEAELESTFQDETETGEQKHLTATEDGDWKVVV